MSTRYAVAVLIVAAAAAATPAQGPRRDGEWEVKMEMVMPGMPAMPGQTMKQCITPEEAKDPQKAMPPQGGRGRGSGDCKVSDYKQDGNKVTWAMKCEGAQPVTGTGEMVYGADSYDGTMKMDMGGRSMTMKYTGKRLGDCRK